MDPFAVLGIERTFDVDVGAVEKRHRELSRVLHPDRYVGAPVTEKRAALAKAVEVNAAWRIVRDPVRRAEALFELSGIAVGEKNEPPSHPEFLMSVMEMRESLAEARAEKNRARVDELARDAVREAKAREQVLSNAFATGAHAGGTRTVIGALGELRFFRRFLEEVSAIEDEWDVHHGTA